MKLFFSSWIYASLRNNGDQPRPRMQHFIGHHEGAGASEHGDLGGKV